jgi:hypothetical protein
MESLKIIQNISKIFKAPTHLIFQVKTKNVICRDSILAIQEVMAAKAKIRTAIDKTITFTKNEIITISSRERKQEKTKTSPR